MNAGNLSSAILIINPLSNLGLTDDRRPSAQHFSLVSLVELDRWMYPPPRQQSTFHNLQGWWNMNLLLETLNLVAISCILFESQLSVLMPCSPIHQDHTHIASLFHISCLLKFLYTGSACLLDLYSILLLWLFSKYSILGFIFLALFTFLSNWLLIQTKCMIEKITW